MERVSKKLKWSDEKFKRRIGTTKAVFGEIDLFHNLSCSFGVEDGADQLGA